MNKARLCKNENCGKPLVMRPDETWAKFAQRLYCDYTCYRQQKTMKEKQRRKEAKQARQKRVEKVASNPPMEASPVVETVRRCNTDLLMARMLRGSVWSS